MFPTFGLDKVVAQIIGVAILLVLLVGGYYWWKHSVKAEALAEWNQKQIEQVQKEQRELIKDLTEVAENQKILLDEMKRANDALDTKFAALETHLNSKQVIAKYKGTSSSEILKRTFKELGRN